MHTLAGSRHSTGKLIPEKDCEALAQKLGAPYFECSARTNKVRNFGGGNREAGVGVSTKRFFFPSKREVPSSVRMQSCNIDIGCSRRVSRGCGRC